MTVNVYANDILRQNWYSVKFLYVFVVECDKIYRMLYLKRSTDTFRRAISKNVVLHLRKELWNFSKSQE